MATEKNHRADAPRRRKKTASVVALLALCAAGGGAYLVANEAADYFEERLARDAANALAVKGYDWASVSADGTQVHLSGIAPDEVARFRALLAAESVVEAGRVIDDMEVAAVAETVPPSFEATLLRNDEGISIIGLVPASLDRVAVVEGLVSRTNGAKVADLLESADYPVPASWDEAFSFGLRAAQLAPRAKITIKPGHVNVQAIADSREGRIALEEALRRNKPAQIALTTDITAPRPVVSPFTLRFVRDGEGARFDACTADSEEARDDILAAGADAGIIGRSGCQLGLGAPSGQWGKAAGLAIRAVGQLEAGSATLSDTAIVLQAPASVTEDKFDEVAGRLEAALPAPFTLTAKRDADQTAAGPAEFSAIVTGPGQIALRGRIGDARMRDAIESFARSRFGQVDSALRLDPDLPGGWTLRAIAALEAMADLNSGAVTVGTDLIKISGVSGEQTASDLAAMRLAERLGPGANYEMAIRYDKRMDPLLGLPTGAECVDDLNTIMRESLIGFEPNKSIIAGDPKPTLELLADAMTNCGDFRIEVGGHTDSQGSEATNAQLSARRAKAVLEAMTGYGIATGLMTSHGYGESQPIADNETDAGREANRRIEFRLLSESPVASQSQGVTPTVTGVTETPGAEEGPQPDMASAAVQAILSPEVLAIPTGRDESNAQVEARETNDLAHAVMVATILVTDLAASPEKAVDTAAELEGTDGEAPGDAPGDAQPAFDPLSAASAAVRELLMLHIATEPALEAGALQGARRPVPRPEDG